MEFEMSEHSPVSVTKISVFIRVIKSTLLKP